MQGQGKMGGGERTLMVGGLFLSLCMNERIKTLLLLHFWCSGLQFLFWTSIPWLRQYQVHVHLSALVLSEVDDVLL